MKVQDHMISHYPAIYLMAQASCQFVNAYRSWRSNLNLIILLQQYVPQHVANNPLRFANKVYCTTNWLGRQLFRVSPKGLNLRHSKMTNPIYDQWRVTIPTVMVNFFAYDFQLIEACSEHPLPWTSRCFGIERFGFPGGLMNFPWFQLLAKLIGPETSPKNPPKSPLRTFFFLAFLHDIWSHFISPSCRSICLEILFNHGPNKKCGFGKKPVKNPKDQFVLDRV